MLASLFLILNVIAFSASTIVLPANQSQSGEDVGIIFLQGASIPAKNYVKIFESLQEKFNGRLWIALTEFPLDIPQPLMINSRINDGFTQLKKAGLNYTKDTPFFFVGHSLGSVFVQDYVLNKKNQDALPVKVVGLILEGGYITRKNRDLASDPSLISSIISVGGELDGLNRISRMSESLYFDKKSLNSGIQRMTYLIEGMNHYQFAGQGNPPYLVRTNDIEAEISTQEAREKVSDLLSSHMKKVLNIHSDNDLSHLNRFQLMTENLANPIIEAFELEGSYHLNTPCYSLDNPEGTGCTLGSKWTETVSQIMMGNMTDMVVTDSFHPVYQINPVHLPAIHNTCEEPFGCTLNVTTVSEPIYESLDSQDISLNPCAASEIKTKMMSRQSILLAATGVVNDLEETDGGNPCADINLYTINWAIDKLPKQVKNRYLASKRQLRVGKDYGPLNVGPLWIWAYLQYNNKKDSNGDSYIELRSPMMYTPYDYPIPLARSFHYCKVLSPAKALEWMYVDSIKP